MILGIGIGIPFGRRGGSFNPSQILGLKTWLKGDAGVSLVGGNVDIWADQSGNGQNCAAPAGINRPSYSATLNGKPVLTFNGTNSVLVGTTNNPLTFSGACSIFVVWRKNANAYNAFGTQISFGATGLAATNSLRMFGHNSGSNTAKTLFPTIATDIWFPSGINANTILATSTAYSSSIRTSSIQNHRTLANSKIRLNGASETLAQYAASNPIALNNNPYQVGAFDYLALATSFFGGDIAEILVYDTYVSDSDTLKIEQYFTERWGV